MGHVTWSGLARRLTPSLAAATMLTIPSLAAQTPPATRPQFKGIWESVSFTEDLDLKDVFFVTANVGWASGEGGTIIHTKDGGANWTAQLGGDPASTDAAINDLRFIDEYRGWAMQGRKLIHTENGQDWEEVPGALPNWVSDYTFVSRRQGVMAATSSSVGHATEVFLTRDGGRVWKKVANCAVRAAIDGLNRNVTCQISRFHFPSPKVGYLIGYLDCIGAGCGGPPVLGKTEDGGATWRFMLGPGDVKTTKLRDVFFTDEQHGFLNVHSGGSEPKIFATADGGQTWKGVIGTPGTWLRFADPEVGWGFEEQKFSYTTDGGARWNSRPHRFPANPRAVSFPRRDRAYVAGDNGMVFRYRVVPASQATTPEVLVTAAMPSFSSALSEQVTQLDLLVDSLQTIVERLPAASSGASSTASSATSSATSSSDTSSATSTAASPDSGAASVTAPSADGATSFATDASIPLDAPLPPPSNFTANCCAKKFSRLETILGAIAGSLPQLIAKNRNSNLLLAAVRMLADIPGQFRSVKGGLAAFRAATDQTAAIAALAQVTTAVETLKTQASAALQKDLPPVDLVTQPWPADAAPAGALPDSAQPAETSAEPSAEPAADSATAGGNATAEAVKAKAADAAKKGLKGLIKKRIKIP
ncbi:MAG: WD40/YVTN/BNR-like repeat-containing protein [Gemmatimonadales bacterium]